VSFPVLSFGAFPVTSTSLSSTTPVRRFGGSADIVLAAALWGTTGTVRSFVHASPVAVGAARLIIGGAFLFVLAVRSGGLRRLLAGGRRTRLVLVLGAVLTAVYQVAFFSAVARTGVATGTVVAIGSGPVFAGLLAWALRLGAPTRRWLLSTAGAVIGCTALTAGGRSAGVEPVGVALALLSGFGYAAYATVASALIIRGEDDRAVVGVLFGGAGALLLPVLLVYGPGWLLTAGGAPAALYLGLVTTGVGYVLYGRGLRTTPVATATTLTLAEPAVAAVLGLFVLGEHLGPVALGGLALLVVSLLVLTLPTRGPR
jgi:DME family drug/metabolite transporter